MNIYVASSWRNIMQQGVVHTLRAAGFDVYDFKYPAPDDNGFSWKQVDPSYKAGGVVKSPQDLKKMLEHPIAVAGFKSDFDAMQVADACVLVLPCGRSAHLEAGWFAGAGRPVYVFMPEPQEPDLMYKMCKTICTDMLELLDALGVKD